MSIVDIQTSIQVLGSNPCLGSWGQPGETQEERNSHKCVQGTNSFSSFR